MFGSPIARLRAIGIAEGISFLLLLGIAMPLKYIADQPAAVTYVGWAHGVLFVLYCLALLLAWIDRRWDFGKAVLLFVASLVPFGPFVAERHLKNEAERTVS